MLRRLLPLAGLLSALLAGCGEPPDTHPGQPVTQRRAAFNKIVKAFEPMGVQLRDGRYDADKFAAQAKALAELKDGPWQYFGPDTNYPPTHAKSAVWSEPERFAKARQDFLQAADQLAEASRSRDAKTVKAAYEVVHESCRSCHKAFKD